MVSNLDSLICNLWTELAILNVLGPVFRPILGLFFGPKLWLLVWAWPKYRSVGTANFCLNLVQLQDFRMVLLPIFRLKNNIYIWPPCKIIGY